MVSSNAAYLTLLLLVAAERLVELRLSKRNARQAFAHGAVETGRKHYVVMTGMHTLFLVSCAAETYAFHRPFPGVLGFAALAGVMLAMALRYWAIFALGERWNTRVIVWPGRAPVTRGPYRFLRHPNYLAVVVEIFCLPLAHGAYLTALVFSALNAALLAVRIHHEETALGPSYAKTFAQTRRLIPGGRHG
ncbi:MAG: isoprenylcysteine carboxyl methyltransferase family protein [Myxococcaceae bacterium]